MKKAQKTWSCVSQCGSCCRLAPEERVEAIEALSEKQQLAYFDLVGADGWCKHYDKSKRICKIYKQRPDFCKVKNITTIFGHTSIDTTNLAISFCKQNIRSIYGGRSVVLKRFNRNIKEL